MSVAIRSGPRGRCVLMEDEDVRFGHFRLDARRRELLAGGKPVPLQPRTLLILEYLIRHRDRAISREELLREIYQDRTVSPGNVPVQIAAIRTALGRAGGDPKLIVTLPGPAYRFAGHVVAPPDAPAPPPAAAPPATPPASAARATTRRPGRRVALGAGLLAATALLGLLAAAILGAAGSRAIVIETFDTPESLAPRGITGRTLASSVLDVLKQLQAKTQSSIAARTLGSSWTNDGRIDDAARGAAFDPGRLLRAAFGHDIHVSGSLRESESAVQLSVRGDGIFPKTFPGKLADLDTLVTEAAEYIYGQTQPARFAVYLENMRRYAEDLSFSKSAYYTAAPEDRPFLLNSWGLALASTGGAQREVLPLFEEAIKQKPDYWTAYNNAINTYWALGDEEAAWRLGQKMIAEAGGRPGRVPETTYENWDTLTWNLLPERAAVLTDAEQYAGVGRADVTAVSLLVDVDWRLHDEEGARRHLRMMPADPNDPIVPAITHFVEGNIAFQNGDYRRAASELKAFGTAYADPDIAANFPGYDCWIAPAEEWAGDPRAADATLAAAGHYVDCFRFRADILDHRGAWDAAQKAYAAAVAVAPDLPAAYYSWGLALARHNDPAGAIEKFAASHARGPHWADPLKAWGDALAQLHQPDAARAKYAEALSFAPDWPALRDAAPQAALK